MNKEIQDYLLYLKKVRKLSENTLLSYDADFGLLIKSCQQNKMKLYDLTQDNVLIILEDLKKSGRSARSINRALSAYRGFYKKAYRDNKINSNPFDDVNNRKNTNKLPVYLSKDEIQSLLNDVDNTENSFDSLRNKALFHLLYSTGCRRAEILSINIEDIDFYNSEILITGKGNKKRYVYITEDAERAIKEYLLYTGLKKGPLFIEKDSDRLSISSINSIFKKEKKHLGLDKRFTPHIIRHSFATHLVENDMDIRVLQNLMGHSDITTTSIYTHLSLKDIKKAYKNAHPHAFKENK